MDDFRGLFGRILGFSVSSLKNRFKQVFTDPSTLDQWSWGFAIKSQPAVTLIEFPCKLCSYKAKSRAILAGHMKYAHHQADEVRWYFSRERLAKGSRLVR